MAYSGEVREKAVRMRRRGSAVRQIALALGVSTSTASLWVRDVPLPAALRELLQRHSKEGRKRGLAILAARRSLVRSLEREQESRVVAKVAKNMSVDLWRFIAAILYWCEGTKKATSVLQFTNSDPQMVRIFLLGLRRGFSIKEQKLRALLHLHDYHDEAAQIDLWSGVTGIPPAQFSRSYRKPNSGVRKRQNYPGCVSIRYGDASIARRLRALYDAFASKYGGVV